MSKNHNPTHKPDIGEARTSRVEDREQAPAAPEPGFGSSKGGGRYQASRNSASRAPEEGAQQPVPGASGAGEAERPDRAETFQEFKQRTDYMPDGALSGLKIAILATDGFEQSELTEPRRALAEAGADAIVVSPKSDTIRGWQGRDWGEEVRVDRALDDADPGDFDALLLPGGVLNPDKLRMDERAIAFVRGFVDDSKPIAAICHGPWTLIEADGVRGKRVTSWPSLRSDLRNAGAQWVDEPVAEAPGLITSRNPDDIPAFNEAMVRLFASARPESAG